MTEKDSDKAPGRKHDLIVIGVCIFAFGLLMGIRSEFESPWIKTAIAGCAGAFMGVVLIKAQRYRARQNESTGTTDKTPTQPEQRTAMQTFLRLLRPVLKLAGTLILGMATLVAVGIYMDHRAAEQATAFCESIPDRARFSELISRADQLGIEHYQDNFGNQHKFMFPGFVFNRAHCIVKSNDGLVTEKRTTPAQD